MGCQLIDWTDFVGYSPWRVSDHKIMVPTYLFQSCYSVLDVFRTDLRPLQLVSFFPRYLSLDETQRRRPRVQIYGFG